MISFIAVTFASGNNIYGKKYGKKYGKAQSVKKDKFMIKLK